MSGVFISYVREDSEIVDKISNVLKLNDVEVWLDRENLLPGMRWQIAIAQAIRNGTFFISIHSQQRSERDKSYVNEELAIAIEEIRKRPLSASWFVPVKIDDAQIEQRPIGGGEYLSDLHYCDLRSWDVGMTQLLRVLGVDDPILKEDHSRKHKRGFVAPYSAVQDALNALNTLADRYGGRKVSRDLAYDVFGENSVKDLCVLGLLQADYSDRTVGAAVEN